jgi:putative FmdB family regulatory protein
VATFAYRCTDDGPFDVVRPIGTATATSSCPHCGAEAVRVWTAPRLSLASPAAMSALDRAERSRSEPDVVTAPPPRPTGRRPHRPAGTVNPALQRLPRP